MIEIKNLTKEFQTLDGKVTALKDISLTVPDGDIYGIIGMSGAGKSTLVRCINMLEKPTQGTVEIDGVDLGTLSEKELREVRHNITMIFQSFNLLMQRTCIRNVTFPLELEGMKRADAMKRAMELLEIVGLQDKANSYPAQLSGGQQQRVAIARALATNPKVLLCDEATSALDPNTTNSILDLIRDINEKMGITVIIITHQMNVVENICKHVAIIEKGEIVERGEVGAVFSHPKSTAAKHLVFPEGDPGAVIVTEPGETLIRVVYNGAMAAGQPMVSRLAMEKGIEANIAYASLRELDGRAYGSMLLGIRGGKEKLEEAIEFLTRTEDIIVEEVNQNVQ